MIAISIQLHISQIIDNHQKIIENKATLFRHYESGIEVEYQEIDTLARVYLKVVENQLFIHRTIEKSHVSKGHLELNHKGWMIVETLGTQMVFDAYLKEYSISQDEFRFSYQLTSENECILDTQFIISNTGRSSDE